MSVAGLRKFIAVAAYLVFGTILTFGQEATVNGLYFKKPGARDFLSLRNVVKDLPADVVVPATITIGDNVYGVGLWDEESLAPTEDVAPDRVSSIRCEDGQTPLALYNAISGWTQLRSIEFPSQLSEVDCDFINNCPALQSITFRSANLVTFNRWSQTSNIVLEAKPVLYVQPELVEQYQDMRNGNSGGVYAKYFLSQISEILPIGGGVQDDPSEAVVDGIIYRLDRKAAACFVADYDAEAIGTGAVIHSRIRIEDEDYPVSYIASGALASRGDADALTSVTVEAGTADITLEQDAIAGWAELKEIDLPANTIRIDAGALAGLSSLETIIIRSNSAVEITGAGLPGQSIGSRPVLLVPGAMVDVYNELLADGDEATQHFLSQMSSIESLDGPSPETPVVTVRYEDTFITLHDARPGHRLHFSSRTDRALNSLYNNDEDHTDRLADGLYTIPEFDASTLLHVTFAPAK